MKQLSIFILSAIIISCNSPGEKQEKTQNNSAAAIPAGSIQAIKLDSIRIPSSIKYRGRLFEAWTWKDALGKNFLVTSFTDPSGDKQPNESGEQTESAELYAYHFVQAGNNYPGLWHITDYEKQCGFDITAEFIKGSVSITDIDKDGTAETWVLYKTACRSDVSPAYMTLVMHEDTRHYILRGNMWIKASEQDSFTVTEQTANLEKLPKKKDEFDQLMQSFGRYENEKDFSNAPPEFLDYARKQWMKFVVESFE